MAYLVTECSQCGKQGKVNDSNDLPWGWLRIEGWRWRFFRRNRVLCSMDCLVKFVFGNTATILQMGIDPVPSYEHEPAPPPARPIVLGSD